MAPFYKGNTCSCFDLYHGTLLGMFFRIGLILFGLASGFIFADPVKVPVAVSPNGVPSINISPKMRHVGLINMPTAEFFEAGDFWGSYSFLVFFAAAI